MLDLWFLFFSTRVTHLVWTLLFTGHIFTFLNYISVALFRSVLHAFYVSPFTAFTSAWDELASFVSWVPKVPHTGTTAGNSSCTCIAHRLAYLSAISIEHSN